jgi:biopolymer transport protein ExbD
MIAARLKRYRRPGGRHGGGHSMPLVPMIDMLVILVVYMLLNTSDYEILPNTKNITIPQSVSESRPRESTVLMITRDTVFVNGKPTAAVAAVVDGQAAALETLRASLSAETQKRTLVQPNDPAAREVTVMADKSLPYSVLKKVMMSATAADVGKLSLAVIEKQQAYHGPNSG